MVLLKIKYKAWNGPLVWFHSISLILLIILYPCIYFFAKCSWKWRLIIFSVFSLSDIYEVVYMCLKYKGIQIKIWLLLLSTFEKTSQEIEKPELGFNDGLNLHMWREKKWIFHELISCGIEYYWFFSSVTISTQFSVLLKPLFSLTFCFGTCPSYPLLDVKTHVYINDSLIYISGFHSLELQAYISPSSTHVPEHFKLNRAKIVKKIIFCSKFSFNCKYFEYNVIVFPVT